MGGCVMLLPNKCGFSMKARRTKTLSSSRLSDISALLGGGKRHGTKTVARFELVIRFSSHLRTNIHHFGLILYQHDTIHTCKGEILCAKYQQHTSGKRWRGS